MRNKTWFFYKPSTQKLLITASLSILMLICQQAIPLLAEESASPIAPTTTSTTNQTNQPSQDTPSTTKETTSSSENTSTTPETPTNSETTAASSSSEVKTNSETSNTSDTPTTPQTSDNSTNPPSQPTTPAPPTSTWIIENDNAYYYDAQGNRATNQWIQDSDGWHYVDSAGAAVSGWFNTPNGKTWYFDPSDPHHPALLGEQTIAGKTYFFDEGYGLKRNGWVHHGDGTWSWVDTYGAFQSGWKKIGGTWFYFDPEDEYYRMKTGTFQISSGTYYVDENKGMTYHDWVRLSDGNWAWADWSGAFVSGWFNTPNGKTWYFDPSDPHHPALLGEQTIAGKTYFFDEGYGISRREWVTLLNGEKRWSGPDGILTGHISSDGIFTADDGSQPTGIIELPGLKLHVDSNHKVKTGWINEDGITHYYQEDGSSASDWVKINGTWYYFDNNGAMQTGWLHLKSGWYYLGDNGKMLTGWIKEGGKDYYLDKNGTMQTGYLTWGNRLYWAGADGVMIEQPCYYPDMYRYAQGYSSATNWLIQVDTTGNRFAVYKGYRGNWVPWYEWRCTTGAPGMWTPHGQFSVGGKGLYFGSGYRCWYYTTITGEYLIHSILYHADGYTVRDGRLGYNGSHGCVRLATSNAKWIYDNIPYGTKIVIW